MSESAAATGSWIERARAVTPGGVHSPVRAFAAMSCEPVALTEARGAYVRDDQGRWLIDFIGAWGPAILGHAHPSVEAAVVAAAHRGLVFGLASPPEVELAERIVARVPGCEMVRFVVTGTEATMTAVRLARAATGRRAIVKFSGAYHGHADSFWWPRDRVPRPAARPTRPASPLARSRTRGSPSSTTSTACGGASTRWAGRSPPSSSNRSWATWDAVPPAPGFLQALRDLCSQHAAVLIFDEVMSGFRVARGGAAERYGVTPDLVTLGKIVGGGVPLAAVGGQASLMGQLAPAGPVYQAGTYAAHPLAVAAGLATMDAIDSLPDLYADLERCGARLQEGLESAAANAGVPVSVQRVGSMWTVFFSRTAVRSWQDAASVDRPAHARFFQGMLRRGVLLPPSPFESAFISIAHDDAVMDETLRAAGAAFDEARG